MPVNSSRKGRPKMRTEDMRIFAAIGTAHTLTQAADQLRMPLFTVSRALKRIEAAAQVVLVRRDGAGLHLTELGDEYLHACQSALQAHQAAADVLVSRHTEPDGLLHIAAPSTLVQETLSYVLMHFLKIFPKLRVHLSLIADLHEQPKASHDIFITAGVPAGSRHFIKVFPAIRMGLFASPKYLAAQADPVHPDDLGHHECLGLAYNESVSTWNLSSADERHSIHFNARISVADTLTLCRLSLASAGIATLPVWAAHEYVSTGALVEVLPEWTLDPIVLSALYNGRLRPGSKESAFLSFLSSVLGGPDDPRCRGGNPDEFFVRSLSAGVTLQSPLKGPVPRPVHAAPFMMH